MVEQEKKDLPRPLSAPTLPRTYSAHFLASSFCWISLTAASACFIAAVAVDRIPPHHPPPPLVVVVVLFFSAEGAFSASCSSELVALGVKLAWYERVLTADLRAALEDLSSLDVGGGGVSVEIRFAEVPFDAGSLTRGVCGRDGFSST